MRSVIVPLYWLWCGVSVFLLARRRITGKSFLGGRTPTADDASSARSAGETFAAPPPPSSAPFAHESMDRQPVAVAVAPSPTTQDEHHSPGPATDATPDMSATAAVRLGVPISTVESLAEALEGIALPCDLAPLIGSGQFDRRSLVLVTSGVPDEIVGTALADEMERLGYTLEPLTEHSILATSDRASVEIAVYSDSEIVDDTGTRRFPTAPSDAIVVNVRLR